MWSVAWGFPPQAVMLHSIARTKISEMIRFFIKIPRFVEAFVTLISV
jgi:hypothetical protein